MFQIFSKKTCSVYVDYIQAEGVIIDVDFSLEFYESVLQKANFTVFSIGCPKTLICKRSDCLLFIKSDLTFNISQAKTDQVLHSVIYEIENYLKINIST